MKRLHLINMTVTLGNTDVMVHFHKTVEDSEFRAVGARTEEDYAALRELLVDLKDLVETLDEKLAGDHG
jgi:hypothetical protein